MTKSLTFHVDEAVWFKSGEGIENILSVSLEPDISIERKENYVVIKGELRLDGEYELAEQVQDEKRLAEDEKESLAYRIVRNITMQDERTAQFQHRFPLEITIPQSRVAEPNDISVAIQSFDYRLQDPQQLELSAQLAIEGVQAENDERRLDDELEQYDFEERVKDIYIKDKTSFSIENKRDEQVTMDIHEDGDDGMSEASLAPKEDEREEQRLQIELKSREEVTEQSDNEQAVQRMITETQHDVTVDGSENVREEREEMPETEVDEGEETPVRSENALYLTKMLAREEGEQFSKLRMRIIQPGDSLDSIAETYEVQPSQITRLNRLHDEQVEEGQIIYIPVKNEDSH